MSQQGSMSVTEGLPATIDVEAIKADVKADVKRELRSEFRDEIEAINDRLDELEVSVDVRHEKQIKSFKRLLFNDEDGVASDADEEFAETYDGVMGFLVDHLDDTDVEGELDDLKRQLRDQREQRGNDLARLRRRVHHLADELDIDVSDSAVTGDDKITQLLKHGPEAVSNNPQEHTTLQRGRAVLSHATDWGEETADGHFGHRITFYGPTVKEKLELHRNENLQSTQIKRVFERLEELAADSPRKATYSKSADGNHQFKIHIDTDN